MVRILVSILIVAAVGVGASFWWLPHFSELELHEECTILHANDWPETEAIPSATPPMPPFDNIFGLHTGIPAKTACATMIQRGFTLIEHDRRDIKFGSPQRDQSFVTEMIFEGTGQPPGVATMHKATVTVAIGAPVTGYQVEAIEVSYFFADQETPEPENKDIYNAFVKLYVEPTSADPSLGSPYMFWVLTEQGLSDLPHDEACDREHLNYVYHGTILDQPADDSCQGVLKLRYGGNNNEKITTARFMGYGFQDNVRMRHSRIVEYTVSQAFRNRSS